MTEPNGPVVCNLTHWKGTPVFVLPSLGQYLKRIYGSTFIQGKGFWLFPAYYPFFENVVHDIELVVPEAEFTDKAKDHIAAMRALDQKIKNGGVTYRPDFEFVTDPYAHQEEALKFGIALPRCGIFYDMGLGKTKVAIDLIRHEQEKTLVLAPSVGVNVWVREAKIHSGGDLKVVALKGTPKKRKKLLEEDVQDADVVAVSYDTAKREHDNLVDMYSYGMIVADESHFLRGYRSARTKCAQSLASRAHRRVILSGTPSLGNPIHLWGQLAFLAPYIPAKDFWTYKHRYCITGESSDYRLPIRVRRNMIVGFKNLDMLNEKVQRVAVRRKKEDCLDLPKRTIQDIHFDIKGDQRKTYNKFVDSIAVEIENGEAYEPANAAVAIQKLLQTLSGFFIVPPPNICDGCKYIATCVEDAVKPYTKKCQVAQKPPAAQFQDLKANPKMDALEEQLEGILAEDRNKCIIWAWFRHELNMIEAMLKKNDIGYLRLDGSNSAKGPEYAQKFNEDPKTRVWLAQVSTGVALTLTAASYMIYYNLPYDLGAYQQAMDRNYRIGQDRPVFVYRLVCKGSVLDYVAASLSQKKNIADTLTDDINCVICKNSLICVAKGYRPFQKGCLYKTKTARVLIKPKKL
jgi:SNF2 family DNA or RNA helicase